MADEQNQENEALPKGGSGKVMIFSGVGLAVVIAAAFLFTSFAVPVGPAGASGPDSEGDVANEEEGAVPQFEIYAVPTIMTNVKGTNKKQILKTTLHLIFETDEPQMMRELFDQKSTEMKNALNILLTGKNREELEGSGEMSRLAVELRDLLNEVVFSRKDGPITKVLYDEYIIQ